METAANRLTDRSIFFPRNVLFRGLQIVIACLCLALFSGQTTGGEPIEAQLRLGQQSWAQGRYDSARIYFLLARDQAAAQQDTAQWAMARFLLGKYRLRYAQDFAGAEALLDSVVALAGSLPPQSKEIFLAQRERAYIEVFRGNLPEAIRRYQILITEAEQFPPEMDSLRAMAYEAIGLAYSSNDEYEQALTYTQKTLALRERILPPDHIYLAYTHNTLGGIYSWIDQPDKGLFHYEQAEAILKQHFRAGHPIVVQVRTNLGIIQADMGLYWEALEYHKANLLYQDSLPPPAHLGVLLNLASTLRVVGDYEESLALMEQAETLLSEYPGLQPDALGFIARERGAIYQTLGQGEKALTYIQEATRMDQKIFGEDHIRLIQNYLDQARAFIDLNQTQAALSATETALDLARRHLDPVSLRTGKCYQIQGEIYQQVGQFAQSLQSFRKARSIFHRISPWNEGEVYRLMAISWRSLGNWDSTLVMHQGAWQSLLPDQDFQLSPEAGILTYWSQIYWAECLLEQAISLQQQATLTQDPALLNAALASYETSFALSDSQRQFYEATESKQFRLSEQRPHYEAAQQIAWQLYQVDAAPQYALRALQIAEKSKAASLREHLRGHRALQFAGVPDSLLAREQYYRQRLVALDAKRFDTETEEITQNATIEDRFRINLEYQTFLRTLAQQFPQYYQLKYAAQAVSYEALQTALGSDQVAYSYFTGDHSIFLYRIDQTVVQFYQIERDSLLETSLNAWLQFISQPPRLVEQQKDWGPMGYALFQRLLPDLPSTDFSLLLIPDGQLSYLPFESLPTTLPAQPEQYRNWAFLGKERAMIYSYAAEIWLADPAPKTRNWDYVGFAPDFSLGPIAATRANWGALQFNQEEVQQVAAMFKRRPLMGEQAQERTLKTLSSRAHLLHFATHAIADNERQLDSYLQLVPDTVDQEDGRLYGYEIYGLNLPSPLTVLSACQTGHGPLRKGEGIMSLARAFQYSGSERVLTTLWKTDDRAGATLTKAFFKGISEGEATELALQHARQHWLSQSDNLHNHPYYWAGFVLIGKGGELAQPFPWIWLTFPFLFLFVALWRLRKRKAPEEMKIEKQGIEI